MHHIQYLTRLHAKIIAEEEIAYVFHWFAAGCKAGRQVRIYAANKCVTEFLEFLLEGTDTWGGSNAPEALEQCSTVARSHDAGAAEVLQTLAHADIRMLAHYGETGKRGQKVIYIKIFMYFCQ